MKRFFAAIAAFLVASLMILPLQAFTTQAHPDRVVDEADVLSATQESNLESTLDSISEKHKMDVVVLTVMGVGEYDRIRDFADDYFDYHGYGLGDKNSGIILVVDCENDVRHLSLCGDAIKAIPDSKLDEIASRVKPLLEKEDYVGAFDTYANLCDKYMNGYENSKKLPVARNIVISLGIALIIALIATLSMRSQLKSVRANNMAADYVVPGSLDVKQSYEIYLYSKVHASKRSDNNSSGGSKTHVSSSGRTHSGKTF